MIVTIQFQMREGDTLERVLEQVKRKIYNQLERSPVLCTHDESDDIVYDINGNRCGRIAAVKETA